MILNRSSHDCIESRNPARPPEVPDIRMNLAEAAHPYERFIDSFAEAAPTIRTRDTPARNVVPPRRGESFGRAVFEEGADDSVAGDDERGAGPDLDEFEVEAARQQ